MRARLATLGLLVGLGSFAFGGPQGDRRERRGDEVDRRAAFVYEGGEKHAHRDHAADAKRLLRDAVRVVEPLIGRAASTESAASIELVTDSESFASRARAVSEPDATVFTDEARTGLVVLDAPVDEHRAALLVHEATRLAFERSLGARLSPWLEEGLACCAEDAWREGVELGEDRGDADRLARARLELRAGPRLERIFELDAAAFERGERVHRDVALAWVTARHLLRTVHGRRALGAALDTLQATHDPRAAERALFAVYPEAELARSVAATYSR